jgi:mono/diheme cytochrome c family protein
MRFLLTILLAMGSPALAQDADRGAELFGLHCASCHGREAQGNGPMASVLTVQPSNLTTLTQRYDGVFPVERVVTRIDGRDPLVSHGSDMPVYGWFFEGQDVAAKTASGQPILTSQPVVDLMAYLETLQQ